MAKIKGMEEHGWLQMTIWMFGPPPSSSVPLQMVICKEDGPPDDQTFFGRTGLNFEKGRLLYIHPVGWSVGWSVDVTINFSIYRGIKAFF